MRKLLSPKWLGLHALTVVLVLVFLALGYWQMQRGEAGNARSWGYAFQWPAFAIFVVFMWVRMMREELHPQKDPAPGQDAEGSDGLPSSPRAAAAVVEEEDDDEDDPELDAELEDYNRWLAALNDHAERVRR